MEIAPIPVNEIARQASLERMGILDPARDPELNRITRMVRRIFASEFVAISLLDNNRQFFKSTDNFQMCETPRDISFCGHAIMDCKPLVIEDAHADIRFCDNPLVTHEPFIRSYAGVPLSNSEGYRIGTLCVFDTRKRAFRPDEIETLVDLAHWVETVIALRYSQRNQMRLMADLDAANRDLLIDSMTGVWNRRGLEEILAREIASCRMTGTSAGVYIFDIDYFKKINDSQGHLFGDNVIRETASIVTSILRDKDIVGRFGGEEFVAILPGLKLEQAVFLGEKICEAVRHQTSIRTPDGAVLPVTVSVGATWLSAHSHPDLRPSDILQIADKALYDAKNGGRDTVRYLALDKYGERDWAKGQKSLN